MTIKRRVCSLSAAFLALGLTTLTGCQPGWASDNTRQGQELQRILKEGRQVRVEAPAGVPLTFSNVEVERRVKEHNRTEFRAVASWRLTPDPVKAREALRALVVGQHPQMAERQLKKISVKASYLDAQGNACGADLLTLDLTRDMDVVVLDSLGKEGTPTRVVLTLESFTLAERETTVPAR
jgi:hypothetical protein